MYYYLDILPNDSCSRMICNFTYKFYSMSGLWEIKKNYIRYYINYIRYYKNSNSVQLAYKLTITNNK